MNIKYFENNCSRFRHSLHGSLVSAHVYGLLFVDPASVRDVLEQYYSVHLVKMTFSITSDCVNLHFRISNKEVA